MQFRVLGPLEVVEGDRPVELGGRRQRALLAFLLVHANEVVPGERLLEELWGDGAVGKGNPLQVSVSRLRKALGAADRVVTSPSGYLLRVGADECDREVFEQLAAEGKGMIEQGEAGAAAATLRRALALWRGPPFVDFLYEPFAQAEIARLEEARLACLEERIDADLALGRHAELVGELDSLIREQPLRERLRGQLMLALYRSGRQADALELYRDTRELFDRELGIAPGPALRTLEAAILRQDPELELPAPAIAVETEEPAAAEPPAPLPAVRKTVTVLVTGMADPPGLDPELRRRLGERALVELGPVLERHGATVEGLQDGRVMAVFGVPAAHEDDALRAVRAAVELRDGGGADAVRTGIDSGEVLTGDTGSGQPLVTGAVVDAAGSLQQRSRHSEILIGETTQRLVRDAVQAVPLERGNGEPAWRLHELLPGAPAFLRRFDAPLVGRDGELAQLRQAFERATRERRAQLITVFGEAGIGKTRLAAELAGAVAGEAQVLTGRCLSYGEGITYWPVREIVAQAHGARAVRELLGDDPDADAIAERLDSAVGTGTTGAVGEEVFWAVRKLAEALARDEPLVLVFEDVHWGEPTLLDLIEHLADWVRSAPVLIVCLARPALLDSRPGWAGGKLNATSTLLQPLSEEESSLLISALAADTELSPQASRRIAKTAEGNPLFLEQMLAMVAAGDEGVGEVVVPPAIQALLTARLDHLTSDERRVIERASVEGELFHTGGVVELSSPLTRPEVTSQLTSLVHKELIRPERPALPGEDAFRFGHALIRDAAYASLPKEARSDLHERYAAWLERALGERVVEGEEFLAYHLEQSHRYRVELEVVDEKTDTLAERAGELLASAGRRAFMRGDWPATVNLYERALALLSPASPLGRELMPDLSLALFQTGSVERADAVAEEAMAVAEAARDVAVQSSAAVTRTYCGVYLRPERTDPQAMRRESEQALAVFDALNDDAGQARAIFNLVIAEWTSGNVGAMAQLDELSIRHARRAGIRPDELESSAGFCWSMCFGPTPPGIGRRRIHEVVFGVGRDRSREAVAAPFLALLEGMEDRLGTALHHMEEGRRSLTEVGLHHWTKATALLAGQLAMLAGDFALAERTLREALDLPAASADRWFSSWATVDLARAVHAQKRHEEAFALSEAMEIVPPAVDIYIRTRRRGARALALASIGRPDEAEQLARDAVELARGTDLLDARGDTFVDLAEVLGAAGRPEEAAGPLREAVDLYERKGNVVSAAKARALLGELAT